MAIAYRASMHRAVLLTGKQWLGVPLLAAPPVLALCGVLGPGRAGIVGRVALVYGLMLASLRVLGKRDLSQMTAFDAVLLFLIPQIFRNYLLGTDDTLLTAVVGATTLLVLVFTTSLLGFRSIALGRLVRAMPTVLAEDGMLIEHALNREHVTPEEIEAAARLAGVEGLASIHRATLEADGKISIIRR
jgi:uncharacterized membrane protein YcaP (DUF421 family)